MRAYAEAYLNDVVENQGKLFDFVAQQYPDKDTEAFINTYMASKTRKSIDEAKPMSIRWTRKRCGIILSKQKTTAWKRARLWQDLCLTGLVSLRLLSVVL